MLQKDKYLFLNSINHQWTNSLSCQCYTVTHINISRIAFHNMFFFKELFCLIAY